MLEVGYKKSSHFSVHWKIEEIFLKFICALIAFKVS
jgi:hypothetical protein